MITTKPNLHIINHDNASYCKGNHFLFSFGAYGDTHVLVFENHLEDALELAAEWLAENEPGHIIAHDSTELTELHEEARDELGIECEASEEDTYKVSEKATADLTYTEAGYLTSHEWFVRENPDNLADYVPVCPDLDTDTDAQRAYVALGFGDVASLTEDPKVKALCASLGVVPAEVELNDCGQYESDGREYSVYTSAEADAAADVSLDSYIDDCILPGIPEAYRPYFDCESWKRNVLLSDGRDHILDNYGEGMSEECINGTWYYIVREA